MKKIYNYYLYCYYKMKNIYPLSYSIPLKKVQSLKDISEKKRNLSSIIPGKIGNHNYYYDLEEKYYKQYEESKYAITKKKRWMGCFKAL